jgi:hypothetical protein
MNHPMKLNLNAIFGQIRTPTPMICQKPFLFHSSSKHHFPTLQKSRSSSYKRLRKLHINDTCLTFIHKVNPLNSSKKPSKPHPAAQKPSESVFPASLTPQKKPNHPLILPLPSLDQLFSAPTPAKPNTGADSGFSMRRKSRCLFSHNRKTSLAERPRFRSPTRVKISKATQADGLSAWDTDL